MLIIDMHNHPFEESAKYLPIRTREEARKHTTGRPSDLWEGWVDKMIQLGIDKAVIFGPFIDNDFVAEMVRKYDPYLIGFAYLFPTEGELAVKELERCVKDLGLKGVKLITFYQAIPFDSPFVRRILMKAQELEVPVVFDCWGIEWGEPIMKDPRVKAAGDPEVYRDLKMDLHNPLRLLLGDFLDGLEDLTIIAAHMGGYAPLQVEIPEERLRQFFFDTAWGYDEKFFESGDADYHRGMIEQMVEKVGADKILFGSDDLQEGALRFMRSLRISDEDRVKIMGENAEKLLGLH